MILDVVEREPGALVYRAHVTDEVGSNMDKQNGQGRRRGAQEVFRSKRLKTN
jgi:hypothetical protein